MITNYYKCNCETTWPYVILITNPSPTNYILTLIKPFSFIWYVIPLLKTGALASTHDLFVQVNNENLKKNKVGLTDYNYWPQYLPNGKV